MFILLKKKCKSQNRVNNDVVYLKCLLQEIYIYIYKKQDNYSTKPGTFDQITTSSYISLYSKPLLPNSPS